MWYMYALTYVCTYVITVAISIHILLLVCQGWDMLATSGKHKQRRIDETSTYVLFK